ncbi:hypothetical protein GE09DRAFT_1272843, partial [Coniochaeta sp. 2T2.1]
MDDDDAALADRILSCFVRSQFDKDNKEFVPEGCLRAIVTKAAIAEQLSEYRMSDEEARLLPELVDFVHDRGIKLFAIAVCELFEDEPLYTAMSLFQKFNFTDENLPIAPWKSRERHKLASFKKKLWTNAKIQRFYRGQWNFLAPVFMAATETRSNYDFERSHILPFIEKYNEGFDRGSFGQVYRYTIHPNHLQDPEHPPVAVKEILPRSEDRQKMVSGWESEAAILQKMNALQQPNIVRFITAFRRGDKGKEDHYLMFEWADGTNLRHLWKTLHWDGPTPDLVKGAVRQILGLARALCRAHYPETGPNYRPGDPNFRHGDLKPENILWFMEPGPIGTLKIADWGLAKQNNMETELRSNNTSTGAGTRRYKPPEEDTGLGNTGPGLSPQQIGKPSKKRSRLYDIWAMGCISLEFVVWLLYGPKGLAQFNAEIKTEFSESPPFFQIATDKGKTVVKVHGEVIRWMDHMAKDPACAPGSTALGSLLELIRTKLLVVKLPVRLGKSWDISITEPETSHRERHISSLSVASPVAKSSLDVSANINTNGIEVPDIVVTSHEGSDRQLPPEPPVPAATAPAAVPLSSSAPVRALANEFVKRMEEICADDEDDNYWFTYVPDRQPPPEALQNSGRAPLPIRGTQSTHERGGLAVPTQQRVDYGDTKLADDWDVGVDNEFAAKLFNTIKTSENPDNLSPQQSSTLCYQCKDLRDHLWDTTFDKSYQMSDLRARAGAKTCDLCGLVWRTCERRGVTGFATALLERVGSSLRINGTSSINLSIFRSPDLRTRIDDNIQIGFAKLPEAHSDAHFEVIKHWLSLCDQDSKHSTCRHPETKDLPTRLIDVGNKGDPRVYLRATKPGDTGTWLALSHRWGAKPHFCTTVDNLADYLRDGIAFDSLSATFRDAVTVTRAVGCRFLWIDSLCIVQGDGGDFNEQAKRMPQVYSGAYCVLAASRATSHFSGFLQPRKEKDAVVLRQGDQAPFYISENIDDFNGHVLESELNSRGWVLQEHALARRTVFFTDHQTYFECGEGVRCETMTTMKNDLSAFLGDPNFPQIIQKAAQGEKILRYQDLYKRYSRLGLSNDFDRPMAIDGLQRRILDALRTQGGFGVFDEGDRKKGLLRRSLLWYRADESEGLKRISFPSKRAISAVPSWSWMAYMGAIEYISPPFNGVAWEKLVSPWSGGVDGARTEGAEGGIAIVGEARSYDPFKGLDPTVEEQERGFLVFDEPGHSEQRTTLCVVLGTEKAVPRQEARCYLILVRLVVAAKDRQGASIYERVGAGWLPGRCI